MYTKRDDIKPFDHKVYLASPTMHGEELKYMKEAFDTNWMSTVGENINEVERLASKQAGVKYAVGLCNCTSALLAAFMMPMMSVLSAASESVPMTRPT